MIQKTIIDIASKNTQKLTYISIDDFKKSSTSKLFEKVHDYSWGFPNYQDIDDIWKLHLKMKWLPDEVILQQDLHDWHNIMFPEECKALEIVFRSLVTMEKGLSETYSSVYLNVFESLDVRRMSILIAQVETIHWSAYSLITRTLKLDKTLKETEKEIHHSIIERYSSISTCSITSIQDFIMYMIKANFIGEGITIMGSFGSILLLSRGSRHIPDDILSKYINENNTMDMLKKQKSKRVLGGAAQIVQWVLADELCHLEFAGKIFKIIIQENPHIINNLMLENIYNCIRRAVDIEITTLKEIFNYSDELIIKVTQFIKYHVNLQAKHWFGYENFYPYQDSQLPEEISLYISHASFFEGTVTDYSQVNTQYNSNWRNE